MQTLFTETGFQEIRFTCWPGGRVSWLDTGGSGETIIFLHGVNGGAKSWIAQAQLLRERYRIIAWNAPGYGSSTSVVGNLSAFVDALEAIIDNVSTTVNLVGHSFGGLVALAYAVSHPETVDRLMLSCTHLGRASHEDSRKKTELRLREMMQVDPQRYGKVRARAMLPAQYPEQSFTFEYLAEIASQTRAEGVGSALAAIASTDLSMQTSKLCMPVGIIWSTQDPVVNEAQTKLLLQCIPQALVQKIDHCGHAPYVEDPDQYFRALVNWLAC